MRRVLVCDDDLTISEIVAIVLGDADWEVYTVPDCNDILKKIADIKPSIIFMDHRIPDHGGIVATNQIKASINFCHIPVIYFTASNNINELAGQAQADYCLQKPFTLKGLETIVQEAFVHYKRTG